MDRPPPSLSLGMVPIKFDDMDSRDIKALFAPLGIPHPPLGHRQTSEYRRILKEWIGVDPGATWLGLQRVQLVKTVIEAHRTRPGGPPSAKDRGKKRAARVEAARVTDTRNAFTWCAWQTPQKVLEQKNDDNTDQMVSQNVQAQIPPHRNEAFDEAFHTKANNTIASMEPVHPRQHLDRPAHGFDSFERRPQPHREPVPMYSETAASVISICIDGQTVCQMPLKTKQSLMQVPTELSIAVSSAQNNKRQKTNLSDGISYKRHTPSENQEYMNFVQPVVQTAAPTQRAHLNDFQNFHTAQNPQIHQPVNEFRQIKPANHEISHLKFMQQPAHPQTWETDPTLQPAHSHIRTFEREVSQIRERQNLCSTMRASCHTVRK